ncbi:M23 family metallopeptidase [Heliorestis convoluta]|uniref:Peptidase M23 family protein n=1 Tax=Heliorestis convoluta TaxID=356322 RepID=A0A5Q2N355_9FIRM|nr:M23 family metallopeptidase [Heliorestis convoluta]QGG47005.1 peptidase M23 family protein [Heliorestis convoluta]
MSRIHSYNRSSKKKKVENYTVFFVSDHGRKRPFRLHLSQEKLRLVAGGAVVFSLLFVVMLGLSFYSSNNVIELQRLRSVNEQQAQQIAELREFAVDVQDKVERIKMMDQQVRQLVGLEGQVQMNLPVERLEHHAEDEENTRAILETNSEQSDARRLFGLFPSRSSYSRAEAAVQNVNTKNVDTLDLNELKISLTELSDDLEYHKENLYQLEEDVEERLRYLEALPSTYPVRGRISSPYGNRPSPFGGSSIEFHSGIDIAADYGTTIRASAAGTVIFAGWKADMGRVIEIQHGYGYVSTYSHLSVINVTVDQKVERGDPIGRVGSSGRSTGPHLHFEIYKNGRLQDPQKYLVH